MSFGILQFDMSMDNLFGEPKQTKAYLEVKQNFPIGDCLTNDISLKKAKDKLSEITKERLAGYNVGMTSPSKTKNVTYAYLKLYEEAYNKRRDYVNEMFELLPKKILEIENSSTSSDCRNKIEQIRLDESGMLLTKQSAISESNVLPSSYKEQYLYIGLGSLVLLVGLYIIAKK
jgi:hypothetical protein